MPPNPENTTLFAAATSDTAPVVEVMERLAEAQIIELSVNGDIDRHYDTPQAAIIPKGKQILSLKDLVDEYRPEPERIKATAALLDLDSLIAYTRRFAQPSTAIFADTLAASPSLLVMIDYHHHTPDADRSGELPSRCTHKAGYNFPVTAQWKAWVKATELSLDPRTMFDQESFAHFLEDRARDIENPPLDWMHVDADTVAEVTAALNLHDDKAPRDEEGNYLDTDLPAIQTDADEEDDRYLPRSALYKLRDLRFGSANLLMKLAQGISLTVGQKFEQKFNTKTGARTLNFEDASEARVQNRKVTVPDYFFIYVPIFENDRPHLLPVRLFYRASGGKVLWGVELVEPAQMIRRAATKAAELVAQQTGKPLFLGRPGTNA
ncbi:hypothetical protein IP70_15820 [alpha proteobacterium AAP38]|nr:hypothetical protein IP70_15820 [alpha proteobacterium AAP38]